MPNIKVIHDGISALPKGPPLVVALTGGTTGIGSYIARALARTFTKHGTKLRVYIVGRQASRAETLIAYGRETSPGSDWRYISTTDLTLMSEVKRVSQEIITQEEANPFAGGPARLDVLYMSQALSPMQPSPQTKESLDSQLSLLYYSRIAFIRHLTPLLTSSLNPSHVISVFAGSVEDNIPPGTLPIGAPSPEKYGITSIRTHTAFMKTFAFEHLAAQHAGKISFTHIYPGLVDGPVFYSDVNPWWFRLVWRVVKPLASLYITSAETCGDVMVFLATKRYPAKGETQESGVTGGVAYSTQRELGGGAYGVGQRGDERKDVSYKNVRREDTVEKVWEHTVGVLERIEKENAGEGM